MLHTVEEQDTKTGKNLKPAKSPKRSRDGCNKFYSPDMTTRWREAIVIQNTELGVIPAPDGLESMIVDVHLVHGTKRLLNVATNERHTDTQRVGERELTTE